MKLKRIIFLPLALLLLASCGNSNVSQSNNSTLSLPTFPSVELPISDDMTSSSPALKTFDEVKFESSDVTYDGLPHTLEVQNAPVNTQIIYKNNGPFINAGKYDMSVTLSLQGYQTTTLNASLTITKATLTGITFKDQTFEYDGLPHAIQITGVLPENSSVSYSSNVLGITNSATEIGSYLITATIKNPNYEDTVLTATLTIRANDENRVMKVSGDTLFFQNALDENKFYAYNFSDQEIVRISGDKVSDIITLENNQVAYTSNALLFGSIKTASYITTSKTVEIETIHSANAQYLQHENANVYYYAINGLTNANSGIYKVVLSNDEPSVTLLSSGKANYLQLDKANNRLYFADGANGNKLSYINTNSLNQQRILLRDEKINNLLLDNGSLYYCVNNLLGDYLEKYTINSGNFRKLTIDAGTNLQIIDGKVYYVNVDILTSNYVGKGIYMVNANPSSDNNNMGTQVVDGGELGVCSLSSHNGKLYYYDVNEYKLIEYTISSGTIKNLLDKFVKPVDPTPLSTGGKLEMYHNTLYYLDLYDGKTLHTYNIETKLNVRVTSNKVEDFSIIGDILYVNMVSYLVNNDLYYTDLKQPGELQLVNKFSAKEVCSDGEYIYYVEENAAGVNTAIHKAEMDGSNDEIIYDKGATNLRVVENILYFIDESNIHAFNLSTKMDSKLDSIHTDTFDTDGTYLYYRDMYGLAYANKRLSRCDLDGDNKVKMVEGNTDPVSIKYYNEYIYYYSDITINGNQYNGLYRVKSDLSDSTTKTLILLCDNTYYAKTFVVSDEYIFFLNYSTAILGDSYIYEIDLSTFEPKKIA